MTRFFRLVYPAFNETQNDKFNPKFLSSCWHYLGNWQFQFMALKTEMAKRCHHRWQSHCQPIWILNNRSECRVVDLLSRLTLEEKDRHHPRRFEVHHASDSPPGHPAPLAR